MKIDKCSWWREEAEWETSGRSFFARRNLGCGSVKPVAGSTTHIRKKCSKIGTRSNPFAGAGIRILHVCLPASCVSNSMWVWQSDVQLLWMAPESFETTTTMGLSQPGFVSLHFPFSTSDLPLSCLSPPTTHFTDLIKMYDFSSFDEMKYNFSTRCVAALQELRCNCNFLVLPEILTFL